MYQLSYRLRLIKRSIIYFFQRRFRGWDDSETFSLDYSIAKLILPRLKRFKEVSIAIPHDLTEEEWHQILDKMIAFFEFASSGARWDANPEEYERHEEGKELFAKWYWSLWW